MKRRSLLLGVAGLAGAGWLLRPSDQGGNHSSYFQSLSTALDQQGRARPTLVIDRAALLQNVKTLKRHIGDRFAYRIVAKSLPSLPLLQEVMQLSGSKRLMLFNQPFINQVAAEFPDVDVLLGKPLPVAAARNFYRLHEQREFDASRQLHWLLDTPERVHQYAALASEMNESMSVCIELDVGLHRGGVSSNAALVAMLEQIKASPQLNFRGLMGYEPHIVKVPGFPEMYREAAMDAYSGFLSVARDTLGDDWPEAPILNAGGSPTYQMYDRGEYPFNELAAGSCLVKPTDFDLPSLGDHIAGCYIAAPVLKSLDKTRIPGIDLGGLHALWNPNRERAFFTDGGYWKAQPVSPAGLVNNPLFGRSTNQDMYNGSSSIDLAVDDWVFLRPTQSEFVFLQFGDIAVLEKGQITERWPVFSAEV